MNRILKAYAPASLIALLIFSVFYSQEKVKVQLREEEFFYSAQIHPGQALGGIVLAGFKGLAVDLIWINLDENFHSGRWHRVLPMFYTVSRLQPHFIQNWALGAWHMAFNVSHEAQSIEKKREWIWTGIRFVKEGLSYNRDRYDLYFETGWIYYQKAKLFDDPWLMHEKAIIFFKRALSHKSPEYVPRLIGHIYRKAGRWEEAIRVFENILTRRPHDHIAKRVLGDLKSSRPLE